METRTNERKEKLLECSIKLGNIVAESFETVGKYSRHLVNYIESIRKELKEQAKQYRASLLIHNKRKLERGEIHIVYFEKRYGWFVFGKIIKYQDFGVAEILLDGSKKSFRVMFEEFEVI
jgi:hypothetical protein